MRKERREGRREGGRGKGLEILKWKTFLILGKYVSLYVDTILDTMKLEEASDQTSIFSS